MSVRLMVEIIENAPSDISHAEWRLLVVLAEKADDRTRLCWPSTELLQRRVGVTDSGLRQIMQSLAARGLEVRVPIGKDKNGAVMYARRGSQRTYRLPTLPDQLGSSVQLPKRRRKAAEVSHLDESKAAELSQQGSSKAAELSQLGSSTQLPYPLKEPSKNKATLKDLHAADAASDADADVIDVEVMTDLDLFGNPVDPPPQPSPVPVIVAMYIDAVRSTDGVATSTMIGAIGKNAKRLIEVDKLHPAVVAVAAQRAGERRAKVLDPFLGAAQSSYNRGGDSRRALFAAWQKMHDDAVAENNASNPQPIKKQIGQ